MRLQHKDTTQWAEMLVAKLDLRHQVLCKANLEDSVSRGALASRQGIRESCALVSLEEIDVRTKTLHGVPARSRRSSGGGEAI